MPRFPYFNFPGFYYRNYNHYPSYAYGQSNVSKNSNVANNLSKSSVNQSNSNFFREIAIDKCHDEKKEKLNDDSFCLIYSV